jgi:uncharacterized protein
VGVGTTLAEGTAEGREHGRLARLPTVRVDGRRVRLAATRWARLVGLAMTDRERAGSGLLIPSCRSVHTFGMRFAIDIAFLDSDGAVISHHFGVPPRRIVADRRAAAVLEVPAEGRP